MHYIHKLTPRQKKGLLSVFVITPLILFSLLAYFWMKNRGMFIESFQIKTVVSSAQGVKPETPVTFSGIKIGWVTNLVLNDEDKIEITMKINEFYHNRIRSDSVIALSVLSIIGKTELVIKGGSKDSPLVAKGGLLESIEVMHVETLMDRIAPLVTAGEKVLLKLERVVSNFPEEKFNATVEDLSEIMSIIREGKSTAGYLISTDDGEFYWKADRLMTRLTELSEQLQHATLSLPSVLDNAKDISESVKDVSRDLPEMRKKVSAVLENLNTVLTDISEMTPSIKRNVESLSGAADELAEAVVPKIPQLLDDVEETLNETLLLLESIKSSWPVKNMMPPESEKPSVEPALRESPYPQEVSP